MQKCGELRRVGGCVGSNYDDEERRKKRNLSLQAAGQEEVVRVGRYKLVTRRKYREAKEHEGSNHVSPTNSKCVFSLIARREIKLL